VAVAKLQAGRCTHQLLVPLLDEFALDALQAHTPLQLSPTLGPAGCRLISHDGGAPDKGPGANGWHFCGGHTPARSPALDLHLLHMPGPMLPCGMLEFVWNLCTESPPGGGPRGCRAPA
jgi:hypothetical protein